VSGRALLGGYAADLALGDPPRWHPVAGFGRAALALERAIYAPSRARGALYAASLVGLAALAGELVARVARRAGLVRAALEHREPGGGGAERAGHADEVARLRAGAADERVLGPGPADDRDGEREHRSGDDVAAGDRRPGRLGELLGALVERKRLGVGHGRRQDDAEVRLSRRDAHRREVGERRGERAVPDVGR
jgi:hypothetical protein